jgi:hypothetical protein
MYNSIFKHIIIYLSKGAIVILIIQTRNFLLYIIQITTTAINTDNNSGNETMQMMKQNKTASSNISCSSDNTKRGMMSSALTERNDTENGETDHNEVVDTSLDENVEENEACDSSFIITPDYIQQSNYYVFQNFQSNLVFKTIMNLANEVESHFHYPLLMMLPSAIVNSQ